MALMRDIKLIATDVDGTLLKDGTLLLNPEYYTVIEKIIEKGIVFVVCSGRQYKSEIKLFAPIKDKLLYVSDGGAVIRDTKEIMKVVPLEKSLWKGMYKSMELLPSCDFFMCTPDFGIAPDAGGHMFRFLKDSYGFDMKEYDDFDNLDRDDIIKFTVFHKTHCMELCSEEFIPMWKDKANVVSAGKEWVDCMDSEANKGDALKWIQQKLGISREETLVFGDNYNDIAMFKAAKYNFAVENAPDAVKKEADGIVAPYWENGVLNKLKELLDE